MEFVAFIGGTVTLVVLGVKAYTGLSDRMTRVEVMQRLLLRKNGYDDDRELDRTIADEISNHCKGGKGK